MDVVIYGIHEVKSNCNNLIWNTKNNIYIDYVSIICIIPAPASNNLTSGEEDWRPLAWDDIGGGGRIEYGYDMGSGGSIQTSYTSHQGETG